ncbi:MAG: prepilin peptidase [Chlorobiaceae bacterium]|nr:prepilin peptidase [Chlorobiaceae bacterium]
MNVRSTLPNLCLIWPWLIGGAGVGLGLVPLARIIPRKVLQHAQASMEEWVGPGGGLEHSVSPARRIWVPLVNASLWAFAATSHPVFPAALLWAMLASALVLLALIDWDTTMLPDWIVLPMGIAGLAGSYAGFTSQNLLFSSLSTVFVLLFLGGFAWVFQRIRGASGIGGGDLKLLAALAAWWGVLGVFYTVLWASIGTVIWNLVWRRLKGHGPEAEWPFGPTIVIAALLWGLWAT